jgi:hypothetical protein
VICFPIASRDSSNARDGGAFMGRFRELRRFAYTTGRLGRLPLYGRWTPDPSGNTTEAEGERTI